MSTTTSTTRPWEGPVIPYEIDPDFDYPARIRTAITEWENSTNVRFVDHNTQEDFVVFRHGQRCNSPTGRQGGRQHVTLSPNCGVAEIVHEIGHAAGLKHEHQRRDRDTFVTVLLDNVEPERKANFDKVGNSTHLTGYDTRSVMHYGTHTHSRNGSPTLQPVVAGTILNSSSTFTASDLRGIAELYPHWGVVRRSDSGADAAGQVFEIAVTRDGAGSRLATAVRAADGTLKVILWRIGATGSVDRLADSGDAAGIATSIAVARGNLLVTACRTQSGNLKLISWETDNNAVNRVKDSGDLAGEVDMITMHALTGTDFVTACRAGNGNLVLITWRLDNGSFRRLADSHGKAGAVSEISSVHIGRSGSRHHVATAVRGGSGRPKVIIWGVDPDGSISRLGDSGDSIGQGDLIACAGGPGTGQLVVSCRAADGALKLITISVSPNGGTLRRVGDSGDQADRIERNSLVPRPGGVLSAVKAANGKLKLISWAVQADGLIARLGDSGPDQAGGVGIVRLAGGTTRADALIATCVQSTSRDLKLITWDDDAAHGELP